MSTRPVFAAMCGLFLVTCLALGGPVRAAPYAAMVMDARTGEVIHSRNADTRLHPASLTKMMTLYIAFEAMRLGEIDADTRVRISSHAASEPPSKIGLRAGSTIRFRFLIRAAAIRSANDAATAIAEALEGSEAAFARRMNRTATALGMTRTTFRNAHGLTEEGHLSTARDMTILGRRLHYDYPQYYNIFSRREDNAGIATVRNTNRHVLNNYRGADGIKTGYTRAAGFNLVASAIRGEERIIATVFGGQSAAWRNQRIMDLLDQGFAAAPSRAPVRVPPLPTYTDDGRRNDGGTSGLVSASLRPLNRPVRAPAPELLAAIEDAVGQVVGEELADAVSETLEVAAVSAPSVPARPPLPRPPMMTALNDAGAGADAMTATQSTTSPRRSGIGPIPRIRESDVAAAVALAVPAALAPADDRPDDTWADADGTLQAPEIVTRASSTGSRLFGVSLGPQASHHAAERLLLRTALSELGTFDGALRRVVQRGGGFEARFAGMTEAEAERACARLAARAMPCEPFGP